MSRAPWWRLGMVLCLLGGGAAELPAAGLVAVQAEALDSGLVLVTNSGGAARIGRFGAAGRQLTLPRGAELDALVVLEGGWLAAGGVVAGGRRELLLVRERGGEVAELEPPAGTARLRGSAVPLVEDGELAGLAWLEGADPEALSVVAAERVGDGWGPAATVSRPETGSQVALAGTVLADGGWLLLWAGVDGEDDEITWCLRRGGGWTVPRRLNEENSVPDITPAVTAAGPGALASWSWFDGSDYRLRAARFDGRVWRTDPAFGERGSLFPGYLRDEAERWLLYQTVEPASWTVLAFDAAGRALRRAVAATYRDARPVLQPADHGRVLFLWPAAGEAAPERAEATWEPLP